MQIYAYDTIGNLTSTAGVNANGMGPAHAARRQHGDHLGSVIATTNSSGVATLQEFDAWGLQRVTASQAIPTFVSTRNYTGQIRDATGLLFYNARYYDPRSANFLSADTVVPGSDPLTIWPSDSIARAAWSTQGNGPDNPQVLNRYAYALNNPILYTDPTGHEVYLTRVCNVGV